MVHILAKFLFSPQMRYFANINMDLYQSIRRRIHPIIHFLNHCASSVSKQNSEYIFAVFCDISKAFDVINHRVLLHTLNNYGIRAIVNTWF